jgi:hypothetical protein
MLFKQQLIMQRGCNMDRISRNDVITKLCMRKLSSLTKEDRDSYILDWWGIDNEDVEFSKLSAELQHQILENEDAPDDSENCKYDELILIALSTEYRGVTNTFLAKSMAMMGLGTYDVYGDVEKLEVCPCCNYRTLDSRGDYDICGLCNWEDSGVEEDGQYSGPNQMTLGEAKELFSNNMRNLPLDKWVKA